MHDFDVLLNTISEKIDLSHGAKRIFTTAGKQIKAIKDLEDGKVGFHISFSGYKGVSYILTFRITWPHLVISLP